MQKPITQRVKGPGGPGKTLPTVTVTAKKKMQPGSYVYIIGTPGKQNQQVTKAQYEKHSGPKVTMKKDDPRLKTLGTQAGKPTTIPGGYIKKP